MSVFFHTPGSTLANDSELLPAEQAFQFKAEVIDDDQVKVSWRIADDYYMYRDKMSFSLSGRDISNTDPVFPSGKIKEDDLFGTVEVYTAAFSAVLPLSATDSQGEYTLTANGQGCNEPIGVCYPPMEHKIVLTGFTTPSTAQLIPAQTTELSLGQSLEETQTTLAQSQLLDDQAPKLNEVDDVNDLRSLLAAGFEQPEFLDVDDAFKLTLSPGDATSDEPPILAHFEIANGYYLYRDKIEFHPLSNGQTLNPLFPKGEVKQDAYFGEVEVFKSNFTVPITLPLGEENQTLSVGYQGCAEDGICYAPVVKTFDLGAVATAVSTTGLKSNDSRISPSVDSTTLNATTAATGFEEAKSNTLNILTVLTGAFIAGLLLSFTPCVLPMIPILSSVIVGQGENLTRSRGGALSIFYVLGTVVTYAAMGALAGATGDQLQAYFQNIWAIGFLSILFLIMSLAMFGVFNLQVPSFIQSKFQQKTDSMRGSIPMVFFLGLISALIVGACVSPILISTLSIAMSQKDPVLGAQIMAIMALGMGVPLIALGFGAGYLIPRAGNWMNAIKYIFGIMLIAVSIYLLESIPTVPTLFLWGAFLVILSIYLGALQSDPGTLNGWAKLEKGIGIVLLVWGIVALIGSFLGQRDLLNPLPQSILSSNSGSNTAQTSHFQFTRVDNLTELDNALLVAKNENKHVMIDYYADWCIDCIRMEKTTFTDSAVQQIFEKEFITLQVDVTDPKDEERSALKKRFNVFGPPAVLFLSSDGKELSEHHFYGYKDTTEFLEVLSKL